jgi:hypothetical protein
VVNHDVVAVDLVKAEDEPRGGRGRVLQKSKKKIVRSMWGRGLTCDMVVGLE